MRRLGLFGACLALVRHAELFGHVVVDRFGGGHRSRVGRPTYLKATRFRRAHMDNTYTYVGGNPISYVDADGLRQVMPLPGDAGAPSRLTGPMVCSCAPASGGLPAPSAGNIVAGSTAGVAGVGAVVGGAAGTAAGIREGAKLGIIAGLAVADAAGCGAIAGATVGGAVGALAGVAIVGGIATFSSLSSNCACVPR
jgi:hypothetical protein